MYVALCDGVPSIETDAVSGDERPTCDGSVVWIEYVPRQPSVGEVLTLNDVAALVTAAVLAWAVAFGLRMLIDASAGRF